MIITKMMSSFYLQKVQVRIAVIWKDHILKLKASKGYRDIQSASNRSLMYQQLIMSVADCLFQSFEGAGSIFVSPAPLLTPQLFKDHTCRAIILINPKKLSKAQHSAIVNLRQLSLTVSSVYTDLTPLFHAASLFISEARKTTNIMVWCPNNRELAAVFAFAHLILKYGYTIDYLWRLYDKRITYIALSDDYIQTLRNLNKKTSPEDEAAKRLNESRLGKRLLRIKESYEEFSKDSHVYQTSVTKSHRRSESNPEKSAYKGLSETDFVTQALQSEPFSQIRGHSSTGNKAETHRIIFKSFDYVF